MFVNRNGALLRVVVSLICAASLGVAPVETRATDLDDYAIREARYSIERKLKEIGATDIAFVDGELVVTYARLKHVLGAVSFTWPYGRRTLKKTRVWVFPECSLVREEWCWSSEMITVGKIRLPLYYEGSFRETRRVGPLRSFDDATPIRTGEHDARAVCPASKGSAMAACD